MIYVCEPQVKKWSHETVNSGFLHGLYTAYGEISFYAEREHIQYIKAYLSLRNSAGTNGIKFKTINFPTNIYNFAQLLYYNKIFTNILKKMTSSDKIIFLSSNPMILFTLNRLARKEKFEHIIFNVVLHRGTGELSGSKLKTPNRKPNNHSAAAPVSRLRRLVNNNFPTIIKKSVNFLFRTGKNKLTNFNDTLNQKLFTYTNFFNKTDLRRFNFIVLSRHILNNLSIDNNTFKASLIWHPCIFPANIETVSNVFPKFGIIGYGTNNGLFQRFLDILEELNPSREYEIRQVTSHIYENIEKYRNVTPRKQHFLQREEMEYMLKDIDYLFNFYDSTQYHQTCSGSIIEAITYEKPVIYIGNDCYDSFNTILEDAEANCVNEVEWGGGGITILVFVQIPWKTLRPLFLTS